MRFRAIKNKIRSVSTEKLARKVFSSPQILNKILNQRGTSIYLALVVMLILLSIGVGLSTIIVGQLKIKRGIENSVVAFYAADTGIEKILYEEKLCRQIPCPAYCRGWPAMDICLGLPENYTELGGFYNGPMTGSLDDTGSNYKVWLNYVTEDGERKVELKSIGEYKGVKRAIETAMSVAPEPTSEFAVWQDPACGSGSLTSSVAFFTAGGYKFMTPDFDIIVTKLCGRWPAAGTRDVKILNSGGSQVFSIPVLHDGSANWSCAEIPESARPTLNANTEYYVMEYATGYYKQSPAGLPKPCNNVGIEASCYVWFTMLQCADPLTDNTMFGQADIIFVPSP